MRSLRVTLGIVSALLGMSACSDSGPTTPGGITTLTEVIPAAGATGVDPAGSMMAQFSGAMAAGMERYMNLHQGDVAGPLVPMSCGWSPDRTTLTCTPGYPLQSSTRYTIYLGSGMMDADGHMAETEQHGMQLGGQPVTGQMMGPMHGGGSGGMAFTFETR